MLLSIAKSRALDDLCCDKDSILSAISNRPGGLDFMRDPSHIKEVIQDIVCNHYPYSVEVACTKGGEPIVPSQDGSYVHGKLTYARPPKPDCDFAHAFCIPKSKLEIMIDLKKKYGGTIDAQYFVDVFYEALEDSKRPRGVGSYAIDTLCGKPFIMQDTVDALRTGLEVTLPADKFVVFPTGAIIDDYVAVEYAYPEGYWCYYDYNGEPPESEDEGDY
jgi:hypothetical protein